MFEQQKQRTDIYKDDEEEVAACKNEKNKESNLPKENLQIAQDAQDAWIIAFSSNEV